MIAGIVTALLMALFIGITAWAWSRHNRARFEDAARLPLEDDFNLRVRAERKGGACCCKESAK